MKTKTVLKITEKNYQEKDINYDDLYGFYTFMYTLKFSRKSK